MGDSAFEDISYALGLGRGEVPRAVPVVLLEGDLTVLSGEYAGPDGVVTTPMVSAATKINVGDYVKLNILSSCTSQRCEGAMAVEKADADGDFIIGQLVTVEKTWSTTPEENIAGTVSDTADITPLLNNGHFRRGTVWLFALHVLEANVGTATAIIPGDSVAPSAGNDMDVIYVAPGLSVADGGQYDTDAAAMDLQQQAYWIAGNANGSEADVTIAVIVGLSPCLVVA